VMHGAEPRARVNRRLIIRGISFADTCALRARLRYGSPGTAHPDARRRRSVSHPERIRSPQRAALTRGSRGLQLLGTRWHGPNLSRR